jgi:conjugative transfer region lipoprotein (TIGR03751 family)
MLVLAISSISLSACSTVSGKIPEKGPTMEQVYDSMESDNNYRARTHSARMHTTIPINTTDNTFHKLPNPELKMYVFPHFAGKDEVPIPGYYTTFNAYTQEHYALPNEV